MAVRRFRRDARVEPGAPTAAQTKPASLRMLPSLPAVASANPGPVRRRHARRFRRSLRGADLAQLERSIVPAYEFAVRSEMRAPRWPVHRSAGERSRARRFRHAGSTQHLERRRMGSGIRAGSR
jgi:hypothetical protein